MGKSNYYQIYESDMVKNIEELTSESSKIKMEIFRSSVMGKDIDKNKVKVFINFINNFLRSWEDFSFDLQEKMKNSNGSVLINYRGIKYQDIKDYIYANYDYAAVLQFTDRIIKGIQSEEITSTDDIEDLFRSIIAKAFNNQPDSVAGLLNSVLHNSINFDYKIDKTDAKLFDSVKTYKNMFNTNSRIELYKAASKTIEFLADINSSKYLKLKNTKVFVSAINNIIEFITYSLTAYATRIYMINLYGYQFIYHSDTDVSRSYHESVDLPILNDNIDSITVSIMKDADETKCKLIENSRYFIDDVLGKFVEAMGADPKSYSFGNVKPKYQYYNDRRFLQDNLFTNKILHNDLYLFIKENNFNKYLSYRDMKESDVLEMNHILKSMIYNNKQGLEGVSTEKQEILHVIRGTESDGTIKGYQQLSVDLLTFGFCFCGIIESSIYDIETWRKDKLGNSSSFGIKNAINEIIKSLKDLYGEIASVIIYKGRDIESKYNNLITKEKNKVLNDINLDVKTGNIENVVPDTMRMPIDLLDLYSLPGFESMQMYDEYVKSLPMFEHDEYYTEGFSDIFNKIISMIQGSWEKMKNFVNNKKVQTAVTWVKDNKSALYSMDFTGALNMEVLPYLTNINLEKGYGNLKKNLKNYNPEDKNFDPKKFISSLYPNPTVQEWFNNRSTCDQKYMNYILFSNNESSVTEKVPDKVALTSQNAVSNIKNWIETVEKLNDLYKGLESAKTQIENDVKSIQSKVIKETGKDDNKSSAGTADKDDNKENQTNQQNKNSDDQTKEIDKVTNINSILPEIQLAVNNLWRPISDITVKTILEMYSYLKEAYSKSTK